MKVIYSHNQLLTQDKIFTYLNANVAAGGSTITVDSIIGFAIKKIILIEEFGNESSEIIKTHASTAPSGNTITLASNLTFAHSRRAKVYLIDYDQIEISHADTVGGTKTVLSTIALQSDQLETQYTDTAEASGYYFMRWKDTVGTTYSDYSDPIPYTGYATNQVGKVIEYALTRNKTDFTDNVNHEFCIDEINACLSYIRGKLKRWSSLQVLDYDLGNVSLGVNSFTLPSNVWGYAPKAIMGVKIGTDTNMTYYDRLDWDNEMKDIAHTTLESAASAAATSITLEDSRDYDDSGSVYILGYTITYTANNRTTGVLSGVPASGTGSITATLAASSDVWSGGVSTGTPSKYTLYDDKLYFYPLIDSDLSGRNIWLDYWTEAPEVDTDGDTLDISRYNMVKYWLTWCIKAQIDTNGVRNYNSTDYKMFEQILFDSIRTEVSGHRSRIHPKINSIKY